MKGKAKWKYTNKRIWIIHELHVYKKMSVLLEGE